VAIPIVSPGDPASAAWANAVANAINNFYQGSTTTGAAVTLSTTSAFASSASVTFTLAVQTRVRIDVNAVYNVTAAVYGRYITRAAYNSGAAPVIGSATTIGSPGAAAFTAASGTGGSSAAGFGDQLLAAGTYTAYASLQRAAGGTATDTAASFYVCVTSLGFV
jgi:hypothetical protein